MDNLIQEAKEYIKKNYTMVEIKEYSKWKSQGIIKDIKKDTVSCFHFDKVITFIDGSTESVWI